MNPVSLIEPRALEGEALRRCSLCSATIQEGDEGYIVSANQATKEHLGALGMSFPLFFDSMLCVSIYFEINAIE